jgi:hypothetical protein
VSYLELEVFFTKIRDFFFVSLFQSCIKEQPTLL